MLWEAAAVLNAPSGEKGGGGGIVLGGGGRYLQPLQSDYTADTGCW